MLVKEFKINERLINITQEDLTLVVDAVRSGQSDITSALIECTKNKFIKNHINIFDATITDDICSCIIWDETIHDYILEFSFSL